MADIQSLNCNDFTYAYDHDAEKVFIEIPLAKLKTDKLRQQADAALQQMAEKAETNALVSYSRASTPQMENMTGQKYYTLSIQSEKNYSEVIRKLRQYIHDALPQQENSERSINRMFEIHHRGVTKPKNIEEVEGSQPAFATEQFEFAIDGVTYIAQEVESAGNHKVAILPKALADDIDVQNRVEFSAPRQESVAVAEGMQHGSLNEDDTQKVRQSLNKLMVWVNATSVTSPESGFHASPNEFGDATPYDMQNPTRLFIENPDKSFQKGGLLAQVKMMVYKHLTSETDSLLQEFSADLSNANKPATVISPPPSPPLLQFIYEHHANPNANKETATISIKGEVSRELQAIKADIAKQVANHLQVKSYDVKLNDSAGNFSLVIENLDSPKAAQEALNNVDDLIKHIVKSNYEEHAPRFETIKNFKGHGLFRSARNAEQNEAPAAEVQTDSLQIQSGQPSLTDEQRAGIRKALESSKITSSISSGDLDQIIDAVLKAYHANPSRGRE